MSEDTTIRRRDFIAGTTAVATGVVLASDAIAGGDASLFHLTRADFDQLVGKKFAVDGVSENGTRQRGTLVLKQVVPLNTDKDHNRPAYVRSEGFSLRFESRDAALASGTHTVSGGLPASIDLQEMLDLRQPGRRHYEAVFN